MGPGTPRRRAASSVDGFGRSRGRLHLRQIVAYEPASRLWDFQWTETAIFLAAAVALAGLCVWWIRTRRRG